MLFENYIDTFIFYYFFSRHYFKNGKQTNVTKYSHFLRSHNINYCTKL